FDGIQSSPHSNGRTTRPLVTATSRRSQECINHCSIRLPCYTACPMRFTSDARLAEKKRAKRVCRVAEGTLERWNVRQQHERTSADAQRVGFFILETAKNAKARTTRNLERSCHESH